MEVDGFKEIGQFNESFKWLTRQIAYANASPVIGLFNFIGGGANGMTVADVGECSTSIAIVDGIVANLNGYVSGEEQVGYLAGKFIDFIVVIKVSGINGVAVDEVFTDLARNRSYMPTIGYIS